MFNRRVTKKHAQHTYRPFTPSCSCAASVPPSLYVSRDAPLLISPPFSSTCSISISYITFRSPINSSLSSVFFGLKSIYTVFVAYYSYNVCWVFCIVFTSYSFPPIIPVLVPSILRCKICTLFPFLLLLIFLAILRCFLSLSTFYTHHPFNTSLLLRIPYLST